MSLRARLLLTIGLSLIGLWSSVALWMFIDVRNELQAALDAKLAASARMVAGLIARSAPAATGGSGHNDSLLQVAARDGIACEVSVLRGEMTMRAVAKTAGSPGFDEARPGYSMRTYSGVQWRTFVLEQGNVRVATADRMDVRDGLLRDVALTAAIPFAVALVASLGLLWFGIGRGLAPLESVRRVLGSRHADDDAPLLNEPFSGPPELQPLVETIDSLLARVRGAIARERRFTDDAAHELRTPLTAVKTHLQVMRLADAKDERLVARAAVGQAEQGVHRLEAMLDQLLLLARLEGDAQNGAGHAAQVNLAARQAVTEASTDLPGTARVALSEAAGEICVGLPHALVVSAVRNLLDNALRVAPETTVVRCDIVHGDGGVVRVSVIDQGPGMSVEDCASAPQRFWRKSPGGAGLGLSIVSAIAACAGGTFKLSSRLGEGTCAELVLPTARARHVR
ncbi:ATP-binding protein [Pseudorhodoferax soli]|uniref:ATP-binding protein n=1 Tax=Pseudorhodoferax soli TaxID=545864 RepID=UPI0014752B2D|nr:ATP-binding protein [Pseudorhodoferax soli]